MSEPQKTEIPALVVQLQFAIGKDRTLGFQTAIDQTETPENIDELLDRLVSAAHRQARKYEILSAQEEIDDLEQRIKETEADLLRYEKTRELAASALPEGRKPLRQGRNSSEVQEAAASEQYRSAIRGDTARLKSGQIRVERWLKKLANGTRPPPE